MGELASFYSGGGFFMYPVTLWGLVAIGLCVLQIVLAKRVSLLVPIAGSVIVVMATASMGTVIGFIQAFESVAMAPPDIKERMLLASSSIALHPLILGFWLTIMVTVAATVALQVRHIVLRGQ